MTQCTELWVDRSDLRTTKVVREALPDLDDGEVLVEVDKFGLTSNNVSYALSGDSIGYWGFYPAPDNWGKVPVWGCGNVVASKCPEIAEGERIYGFMPLASHAMLRPGRIKPDSFVEVSPHRDQLPGADIYSTYRRTNAEPEFVQGFETERCLLFPLFATSFVLYDFLIYNEFFGAQQVVIGSVSSKTGFGLAKLLHDDDAIKAKIIGVTSAGNRAFVEELACCDQIVLYGEESQIDSSVPTAYVDMSGNKNLTAALHQHLADNMVSSTMVGATNWEQGADPNDQPQQLPGAKPTFFFAPAHIAQRNKDWGPGVLPAKAMEATFNVATATRDSMQVEWVAGAEAVNQRWQDLLDNKVSGSTGIMATL